MDFDDLTALVAIADEGSLSGAAAATGVPRSSLARAVERLEAAVGAELVRTGPGGAELSAIGRSLVEPARRLLARVDACRARLIAGVEGGPDDR